ncbi:hypothetical protein HN615_16100 [Candidatus Woesearchaeota archaeon]|jgi:hypothetical protein|nr:hypothetical protein [bacterium]MBT7558424.1 hypothetical protein [Candidatus Woesearchaeota archaeon]
MKVILHIGLHKTASTFLQNNVFSNLDSKKVIYNPEDVFYFVNAIFTLGIRRREYISKAIKVVKRYSDNDDGKVLLISSEVLSEASFLQNYYEHILLMKEIFPSAEIVLFLRNQIDWIKSYYRQSVKVGFYQDLDEFLNYSHGEFESNTNRINLSCNMNLNVFDAHWGELVSAINSNFKREHIFFFENFKKDGNLEVEKLLKIFDIYDCTFSTLRISNKGLSGSGIKRLVRWKKAQQFFFGKQTSYAGRVYKERNEILEHDFFWKPIKPSVSVRLIRFLVKEPMRFIKRFYISSIIVFFDKFHKGSNKLYKEEILKELEDLYTEYNRSLVDYVDIKNIPKGYIKPNE